MDVKAVVVTIWDYEVIIYKVDNVFEIHFCARNEDEVLMHCISYTLTRGSVDEFIERLKRAVNSLEGGSDA
jgi:predicted RNA-binding protein with PIN domain